MANGKLGFAIALNLASEKFKQGIKGVQGQLQSFKKFVGQAFAGLTVLEFGRQLIQAGSDFQGAMARVQSVSKASKRDLQGLREEALRLGRDTKYTATQAADAMEILVRNGLSGKAAKNATQGVLELAQSQAIELAQAADVATTAMNGFNMQVSEMGRINDVLASTASNSATNVLELGEAMKYAAPVANVLGINIEEVSTLLAQLAQRGIKGSEAGTAIKQIMTAITSQTPEAQKALKKYGLEINETTLRTDGLMKTLERMRLSGIGNSLEDIEGFSGKLAAPKVAAALSSPMGDLYGSISSSQGEAARMFNESLGAFESAKYELLSVYENTQVKTFEGLKSIFTEPLIFLTELIRRIQDIPTVMTAAIAIALGRMSKQFATTQTRLYNDAKLKSDKAIQQKKDTLNDANLANEVRGYKNQASGNSNRMGFKSNSKEYFQQLNTELRNVNSNLLNGTKGSLEFQKALKNLDILSSSQTGTKKFNQNLREFQNYMKQVSSTSMVTDKMGGTQRIQSELQELERQSKTQVSAASSAGKTIQTVFTNTGNAIKSFGKGVFSMMGGWVGIIVTVAAALGTYLVSAYRNATKAQREMAEGIKEVTSKNAELDTTFMQLVNVLRTSEKTSAEYKAALAMLKREYPELIEKLDLEKMSVHASASEWKNYKQRIGEAIQVQKDFNSATFKLEAEKKLREGLTKTSGFENAKDDIKRQIMKQKGLTEEVADMFATTIANSLIDTLMSNLSKEIKQAKIGSAISESFKNLGISDKQTRYTGYFASAKNVDIPSEAAEGFVLSSRQFAKAAESLSGINTKGANISKTGDELINEFITNQKSLFDLQRQDIVDKAKIAGTSKEDINEQVSSLAKDFKTKIIDGVLSQFKDANNKKGDKIDLSSFVKSNSKYQEILSASLYNKPVDTKQQTKSENIADTKQKLDISKKRLDENLASGYIDQAKYNQKYKSAIESTISNLEMLGVDEADESFRKLINANEEYANKVVTDTEAKEKAKEAERQAKEDATRLAKLQKNTRKKYDNVMSGAGKEKVNKWDLVSSEKDNGQAVQLDYIKSQLDSLKELKADIGDDVIGLSTELDTSIESLTKHVNNLEDAFEMKKAQKHLKELKRTMQEDTLGAITQTWQGITGLKGSIDSIGEAFENGDDWDKFSAIVDSTFNLIDTISSLINVYNSLSESIQAYQLFQETLQAVESGAAAEKIIAIQTEAAAVVEAEALKSGAKTVAMTEQATTALATGSIIAAMNGTEFKTSAAAGVANAVKGAMSLPYPANLVAAPLAATAAAGIFAGIPAAIASIPMLAEGGVATSATLAMIGEGAESEAILPLSKLNSLLDNKGNSNGTGGQVEFRIDGQNLVGVLNNYNKRTKKLK